MGNDRLLVGKIAQGLVERLAAGGAAARAVDRDDHALDGVALADLLKQFLLLAVIGDEARNGHPRDMRPVTADDIVDLGEIENGADQHHRHGGEADDAPKGQLPPQPPAVHDDVGIQCHGRTCLTIPVLIICRIRVRDRGRYPNAVCGRVEPSAQSLAFNNKKRPVGTGL